MDMLINNVDYFDTCEGCPCYDREWERCGVTLDTVWNPSIKRYEKNCLVKMIAMPHGRLIDADELLKTIEANDYLLRYNDYITERGMFTSGIKLAIAQARTIIKSSENEERTN